ncbi:MAG: UDP-N-acetylglucosamine 1-carboxyvinyltransferase [Chitinivibrionales bacterium]|nr:UDP-N-acetylglucosamine 1-carboxyvinyltransferase [Chitinivibrionales bacterium]
MAQFIVEGGKQLHGSISVTGNKNEALPLIAASLLCADPIALYNSPDIVDVRTMLEIAEHLGTRVKKNKPGIISLHTPSIEKTELPLMLSSQIRASILFASALLARTGQAIIPQPGGDSIGRRRLDTHFLVFEHLGAKLKIQRKVDERGLQTTAYVLEAPKGITGASIYLDEASVTATENALILASAAKGKTTIANAASEPHVQGLCHFLKQMGVKIKGVGSNMLTVYGTDQFTPAEHVVGSDYIEAASFIGLAAATRSSITVTNINTQIMRMILFQFERIGVVVENDYKKRMIHVPEKQPLTIKKDLGSVIPKIEDSPWPGFPADLVSILLVVATQSRGTCLIHEKMFEARLFFVDKLLSMGAQIVLCDPHRAVIVGPSPLYGASISSPDIRAGMALLIAALAAEGQSHIQNIDQIDRGYQNIDIRLQSLGAQITRKE